VSPLLLTVQKPVTISGIRELPSWDVDVIQSQSLRSSDGTAGKSRPHAGLSQSRAEHGPSQLDWAPHLVCWHHGGCLARKTKTTHDNILKIAFVMRLKRVLWDSWRYGELKSLLFISRAPARRLCFFKILAYVPSANIGVCVCVGGGGGLFGRCLVVLASCLCVSINTCQTSKLTQ